MTKLKYDQYIIGWTFGLNGIWLEIFWMIFSNNTYSQVNEFLKLKPTNAKVTPVLKRKEPPTVKIVETSPAKKPKINLVLASSPVQQQQHKVQTNTGSYIFAIARFLQ